MGVIRITSAFKSLIKRGKGRIINTASVCGRVALPGLGPYTLSKYAVEAYSDTLRSVMHINICSSNFIFRLEMKQFGVRVIILEPGFYQTPITNIESNCQMFRKLWLKTSEQTREEYGEEFYRFCKFFTQTT